MDQQGYMYAMQQQQQESFQIQRTMQARREAGIPQYIFSVPKQNWHLAQNGELYGGYESNQVRPAIKANNDLYGFDSAEEVDSFFDTLDDARKKQNARNPNNEAATASLQISLMAAHSRFMNVNSAAQQDVANQQTALPAAV